MCAKVLLIDDDAVFGGMIRFALEDSGYETKTASSGLEGLQQLCQWRPDLILLDSVMPGMDGWETCQRIREVSDIPILMLVTRDSKEDELRSLRCGADQCMVKPFPISVLIARAEAMVRRSQLALAGLNSASQKESVVATGDLRIDLNKNEVTLDGKHVNLSPTEFRLLVTLASRIGKAIPHRELLAQVWGPEYADKDLYLKLYVYYLRRKIEADPAHPRYVITKWGLGYYLNDEPTARKASSG